MQFDIDKKGQHAEIFLKLQEIVLSFKGVREQKNAKQTAYYDRYSAICFLRGNDEKFTLSLAKGALLQENYPFLQGDGKVARHIYYHDISEVDEAIVREIIQETMILNMEEYEMKKLRCNSKHKKTKE
jgi:hypothetical protein